MDEKILEDIKKQYAHYSDTDKLNKNTAVYHIRLLLEEVERLRKK